MIVMKYAKSDYQGKIIELENYHRQLSSHLDKMNDLRDSMHNFWNDKHAQDAGRVLLQEITTVQNAMDRTGELIALYKGAIEQLDTFDLSIASSLEGALSLLLSEDI